MRPPRFLRPLALALVASAAIAAPASAQVAWTDWTSTGTQTVGGSFMLNAQQVNVTFRGDYSFAQLGCGGNYWAPNVYTGVGVPNAPPDCDIIGLSEGGLKTITFSQAVVNPLIALVSWNGQPAVTFSGPLQVVANGCGYWGCGSINVSGNDLFTSGEAHGTIRLLGTYTSFSFTDGSEGWHGITVGAESLNSTVPEPGTYLLTSAGLVALFGVARRRRTN